MITIEAFLLCSMVLNVMLVMVVVTIIGMYLDARYWRDIWRNASVYGHGAVLEDFLAEDDTEAER